jgi:hypothetical protein
MDSTKEIIGKSVAVVGGSDNIVGQNLGSFIDCFDYVVKFNGSLFIQQRDDYKRDYGVRDDIHFLTNPFVRELNPDLDGLGLYPFYLFKRKYPQYNKIKYEIISQSFKEIENKIEKGFVYSGIAVIYHLLKQKPSLIQLFAMDMYRKQKNYYDGSWIGYLDGYIPQKMKDFTDREHSDGHLAHSRYWNAVVLSEMSKNSSVLKMNGELRNSIDYIIKHREEFE